MKKAVLFALIALLGGLALGTLFGSGISSASLNSVRATAAEYPAVSALDAIEVEGTIPPSTRPRRPTPAPPACPTVPDRFSPR